MPKLPAIDKIPQEIKNKYSIVNNAFIRSDVKNPTLDAYKHEPKDEIKITLGDKDKTEFTPDIELKRWNEVSFKLKPRLSDVLSKDKTLSFDKEKIKFNTPKISFEMYDYTEGEGGFKYVWYLNEKPTNNKIEFDIETSGLNFYHQPPMTEEHLEEGQTADETHIYDKDGNIVAERPIEVVNSYAVYHSTKGGINDINGKDYKAGKAFHIYRPRIIDAEGKETWGILHIENGIYSVEIPQDFLDKAVYPIKSNDTWGNTGLGASVTSGWNNRINMVKNTAPADGTLTSYSYGGKTPSGTSSLNCGLYVSDGSNLVANSQSDERTDITTTKQFWEVLDSGTKASIANGTAYVMGCYVASVEWAYDSSGTNMYTSYIGSYASTMPASVTVGSNVGSLRGSIYATYTPTGGTAVKDIIGGMGIIPFAR